MSAFLFHNFLDDFRAKPSRPINFFSLKFQWHVFSFQVRELDLEEYDQMMTSRGPLLPSFTRGSTFECVKCFKFSNFLATIQVLPRTACSLLLNVNLDASFFAELSEAADLQVFLWIKMASWQYPCSWKVFQILASPCHQQAIISVKQSYIYCDFDVMAYSLPCRELS